MKFTPTTKQSSLSPHFQRHCTLLLLPAPKSSVLFRFWWSNIVRPFVGTVEVTDHDMTRVWQQNVLWLYIQMNNSHCVDSYQTTDNFTTIESSFFLAQRAEVFYQVMHAKSTSSAEDHHGWFVMEEAVVESLQNRWLCRGVCQAQKNMMFAFCAIDSRRTSYVELLQGVGFISITAPVRSDFIHQWVVSLAKKFGQLKRVQLHRQSENSKCEKVKPGHHRCSFFRPDLSFLVGYCNHVCLITVS